MENNEDAIQLPREANERCAKGGFRLHKFGSNNTNVLESIPPSEQATNVKVMDIKFDDLPPEKALGIKCDVKSNHFRLNVSLKEQLATRCGILSTVASLYDPFGFVAPVLLKGNVIL